MHRNNLLKLLFINDNNSKDIVATFHKSLESLFSFLRSTRIKYIKCIKPNYKKESMVFNNEFVANKLKASGILQSIQLSNYLFPYNIFIDQFDQKYGFIKNFKKSNLSKFLRKVKTRYLFNNEVKFTIISINSHNDLACDNNLTAKCES